MKKRILSTILAAATVFSAAMSAQAVTARDALQLLKRITSKDTTLADDYNGDGKVTAKDVLAMLRDVTGGQKPAENPSTPTQTTKPVETPSTPTTHTHSWSEKTETSTSTETISEYHQIARSGLDITMAERAWGGRYAYKDALRESARKVGIPEDYLWGCSGKYPVYKDITTTTTTKTIRICDTCGASEVISDNVVTTDETEWYFENGINPRNTRFTNHYWYDVTNIPQVVIDSYWKLENSMVVYPYPDGTGYYGDYTWFPGPND